MKFFSRTDKSVLGSWWWTVDRVTLAVLMTICVFGIVLVTAASPSVASRIHATSPNHFIIRHVLFLIPSLFLMLGISMTSLQNVWRTALVILAASLFLMLLVPIFGDEVKGAQRWIGVGMFSLQPSELAKPAFIVVAAWLIARQKERPEFKGSLFASAVYCVFVGMLLMQPDMGMSVVVTASFLTIIFLAGLPLRWIILLLGAAMLGAVLIYFVSPHVQARFDKWVDADAGDNYQVNKALLAFEHGGLFGTGAGQGTVKMTIPDAHADFIFAVAGEELGMLFTTLLIALYLYIVIRGYNRIMDTDNIFIILASGGLLTLFGLQALINMGSSTHLLPTKGMTLPFISYGGSSLLSSGIGMGMLLALTRKQARSGIARGGLSKRPIGSTLT